MNFEVLSEQGSQNLFNQIHVNWVAPELERRRKAEMLSEDFRIRRCLIKLPNGADPVVEFNDEISWMALVKKPTGIAYKTGDPVHLSQIEGIESVEPPSHDGKRVAFIFLHWNGKTWQIILDSTPNLPDGENQAQVPEHWELGHAIADSINLTMRERVVLCYEPVHADVTAIGLWAAPSLLPYPLSAITEHISNGNPEVARQLLVKYCTVNFLRGLIQQWKSIPGFAIRQHLFDDAIAAHERRQFTLTIPSLVPHFEGIVTDWIISKLPAAALPFKQESKTRKFRDLLAAGAQRTYTDERIAESVIDFMLNGPILASFSDWESQLTNAFPNRHTIGHGKYDPTVHTEENSIKVFLLLDTLFHIMMQHTDSA